MKSKKNVLVLAFLLIGSFFVSANESRDPQDSRQHEQKAMQSPTQVATKLAKALKLSDDQSEKFIPLYADYMEDIRKMIDKHRVPHNENITDEQLEKIIESRFAISRSIVDIREKYYKKYKKFLSIRQIDKLYETEKKLDNRRPEGNNRPRIKRNRTQRR